MTTKLNIQLQEFEKFLLIEEEIVNQSDFTPNTKLAMINLIYIHRNIIEESIQNNNLTVTGLKYLVRDSLTYWNKSINLWTELLWEKVSAENLSYVRKEPLKFVLEKGRFRYADQGRGARYNWDKLLESGYLNKRYSQSEIQRLTEIITNDEMSRVSLLKKCIKNKKVPDSQYLRFGDSVAYLTDGKLIDNEAYFGTLLTKHFSEEEIAILDSIWK